jgi:Kef-type K+ transport system membrane component KefB
VPSSSDLALHLFLQLGILLASCRLVGFLLRYVRQPQVVGEMVAGIVLGPSLFGLVAPGWQRWLFPQTLKLTIGGATGTISHPSLDILYALGQLGLVLYMFLVGLEFDTHFLRRHLARAGTISLVSIALPLALGGMLGFILGNHRTLFPAGVSSWQAAQFLGCALSVTAFPVLARIIRDLDIGKTSVGVLALGAAATCDITAWCLLAVIIAGTNHSPVTAALALGGGVLYVLAALRIARPLFRRLALRSIHKNGIKLQGLAAALVLLMLCAWYTDAIGIYSVFGAFLLGAVMPRGRFAADCHRLLEPPVVILLLPIYFVYSGLNTRIDLLTGGRVLEIAALIVVVAFIAKAGGVTLASRLTGFRWRDAASLGVLMNARGVMELVLINIGLQKGLITPTLFTVLVLMTIVTTLSATPLFQLLYRSAAGPGSSEQGVRSARVG